MGDLTETSKLDIHLMLHTRNHMFRVAEGLSAIDRLRTLGTIYPGAKIATLGFDVSKEAINTNYVLGLLAYLKQKRGINLVSSDWQMALFDSWASKLVAKLNTRGVIHSLAGSALTTFRRAKNDGHLCVLERSCPHISFQDDLLKEEADLQNLKLPDGAHGDRWLKSRMLEEYELADKIVVSSNFTKNSFIEFGFDKSKLVKVACPPANVIKGTVRKCQKDKPLIFLSVGTNFLRKGFSYLIDAWKEIDPCKARLVIKGPLSREAIKSLPAGITHIPGRISQMALNDLYAKADVFCLPSVDEGFGMVVLEAMSSGLPVMVSRNVGASDIVNEGVNGFIFDIRSSDAIRETATFYIQNKDKVEEMSSAALRTAAQYDIQSYKRNMNEFYDTLD